MSTKYKFYVEAYTSNHIPMLGTDHNRIFYNKAYRATWWYGNLTNSKPRSCLIAYYKITAVCNTQLINCDKEVELQEYLINPKYKEELADFIKEAESLGIKVNYINPIGDNNEPE